MNAITAGALAFVAIEAVLLGYVMRRRGFDAYVWTVLGLFLGPIAVGIAISFAVRPPRHAPTILRKGGAAGTGHLDVLVGYDGSAASAAALARVESLLGSELGRVAVARVTPLAGPPADKLAAQSDLERVVDAHRDLHAAAVMLEGDPAAALQEYARQAGFDMIVVGTRGSGFSKLMGSVATALARHAATPVLLVDGEPAVLRSSA